MGSRVEIQLWTVYFESGMIVFLITNPNIFEPSISQPFQLHTCIIY
jgi:hypothetical protein